MKEGEKVKKNNFCKIGITLMLIPTLIFSGCSKERSSNKNNPVDVKVFTNKENKSIEKVAENEFLELSINYNTTEISVKNKKTGEVWNTNPQDIDKDTIANQENKNKLKSQISVQYNTQKGEQNTIDNFTSSISLKQYEINKIASGVRVDYTLGKVQKVYLIPKIISESRFKSKILNNIKNEKDKTDVLAQFKFLDLSKVDPLLKADRLKEYPMLKDYNIYVDRKDESKFTRGNASDIIIKAGYTLDDLEEDNKLSNEKSEVKEQEIFGVSMIYTLDKDSLVVSVPGKDIKYPKKFPVTGIKVLEFFGATNNNEQGYMLVPDGSGAIINLNNNKHSSSEYSTNIYGSDKGIVIKEQSSNIKQAMMPVFGMKKDKSSFIADIEDGEAFASIKANTSGKVNSYNNVYPQFTTIFSDKISLDQGMSQKSLNVYQERIYQGDFKIRYSFVAQDKSNYVGMAEKYRQVLIDQGKLNKVKSGDVPFILELLGGIDKVKNIRGIPQKVVVPLTKYNDAEKILEELQKNKIDNIKLRYVGWSQGGINSPVFKKLNNETALGSENDLKKLIDYTGKSNIKLFLDSDLQYVYKDKMFDGFSAASDASRLLTRKIAQIGQINYATFAIDKALPERYIVSPKYIANNIDKYVDDIKKLKNQGVSLTSVGTDVNSDFKIGALYDRQESVNILKSSMQKIKDAGKSIMVSGDNSYVIPYADYIVNIPYESNNFYVTDGSIPFAQIVLHGYKQYSAQPLNLSNDYTVEKLKVIETGAIPYYQWIYEDNSVVKDTNFNKYYSVQYNKWIDDATKFYNEFKGVMSDIQDKTIIEHSKLQDGVYKVKYENGKVFIINYNNYAVKINNNNIQAKSYIVAEGGN